MARRRVKKQEEIIEYCDYCGKPLGRQCVRTNGSAICAICDGLKATTIGGKWNFYCCMKCMEDHNAFNATVRYVHPIEKTK